MQQIITFRYQSLCVYFLHNYCEKNVTITVMYKIIIIFCNSVVFLSWVLNIERSVSFSLFKSNCVYLNVSMFSQLIISCDSVSSPLFLPPHLHDLPPSFPSLYLLSPCEYFTLLLPLVRDARDWALIVCTVWALRYATPRRVVCRDRRVAADASQPPACLSVFLFGYTWPALTLAYPHTLPHIQCSTTHSAQKSD